MITKKHNRTKQIVILPLTVIAIFLLNNAVAASPQKKSTGTYNNSSINYQIAVDLNRDGYIDSTENQPRVNPETGKIIAGVAASDKTEPTLPFRFWINNDLDLVNHENAIHTNITNCEGKNPTFNAAAKDGETRYKQVCEQWDENPVIQGMTNTSDNNLKRIETDGDLEDFSPLLINIDLEEVLEEGYSVELRAVGVGINIFQGTWSDDGKRVHAYIYDSAETKQQITKANAADGHVVTLRQGARFVIDNEFLTKNFDSYGNGHFIFEGISACQNPSSDCYISLGIYQEGNDEAVYESRVYLDLHETKDFYEHITSGTAQGGNNPAFEFNAVDPTVVTPQHNRKIDIYAGLLDQEKIKRDTIIYVHGWRVLDIEKLSFGETAFKRLYWSGYYGQFTRLSWPTGWFDKPANAYGSNALPFVLGNERNYNLSETVARKTGEKLKDWIVSHYAGSNKHVIAHSMGNVVVSEALRTAADGVKLLTSYSPSQSAESAGAYDSEAKDATHILLIGGGDTGCDKEDGDGNGISYDPEFSWRCYNKDNNLFVETAFDMPPDLWRNDFIERNADGKPILDDQDANRIYHPPTSLPFMGANDLHKHYYKGLGSKVGTIMNLYNAGDSALSAWEFNQLTKPDFLDGTTWHYSNEYLQDYEEYEAYEQCLIDNNGNPLAVDDCVSSKPDVWPASIPAMFEADGVTPIKYYSEFKLGNEIKYFKLLNASGQHIANSSSTALEILSHVIPARTAAVGQVVTGGEFADAINSDSNFTDSNHDHSAPYYGSYSEISPKSSTAGQVRADYWKNILRDALDLTNDNDGLSKLASQ